MSQFPQSIRDSYDKMPNEIDFRSLYNWAENNNIEVIDPLLNKKVPISKQLIGEIYEETKSYQMESSDVKWSIYKFLNSRPPNERVKKVLREMMADTIPLYLRELPPILADESEHIQTLYDELVQMRCFLLRNIIGDFNMMRLEKYNIELKQLYFHLGIDPDGEPIDIEQLLLTQTFSMIEQLTDEQILLMQDNFDDYYNLRCDAWAFLFLFTYADHEHQAIVLKQLNRLKKAVMSNEPDKIDNEQIQLCERIRDKSKSKESNIIKVKAALRNKYSTCEASNPLDLFEIMLDMTTMNENDWNILIDFFHLGGLENERVKHLFIEIGKITNHTLPEYKALSIAIKEEAVED